MGGDPVAFQQLLHEPPVQPARGAVVNVFGTGLMAELGGPKACAEPLVMAGV